jgi:DMSO reductase anchor subunit
LTINIDFYKIDFYSQDSLCTFAGAWNWALSLVVLKFVILSGKQIMRNSASSLQGNLKLLPTKFFLETKFNMAVFKVPMEITVCGLFVFFLRDHTELRNLAQLTSCLAFIPEMPSRIFFSGHQLY